MMAGKGMKGKGMDKGMKGKGMDKEHGAMHPEEKEKGKKKLPPWLQKGKK